MDIGVSFPTTNIGHDSGAVREFVQVAEDLGYDHLRILDHVVGANPENIQRFHSSITPTRA